MLGGFEMQLLLKMFKADKKAKGALLSQYCRLAGVKRDVATKTRFLLQITYFQHLDSCRHDTRRTSDNFNGRLYRTTFKRIRACQLFAQNHGFG